MPPPPIPLRTERGQDAGINPPLMPARSPRRPPTGAVATAMVSGEGRLPSDHQVAEDQAEDVVEDETHARNPYDLRAIPGSIVTASYPFRGEEKLQQLSFAVSCEPNGQNRKKIVRVTLLEQHSIQACVFGQKN